MHTPHRPVLVDEVICGLAVRADGIYVDATVGGGGHAEAICELLGPSGRLIGIDCDEEILAFAERRLVRFGGICQLLRGHYEDLRRILAGLGLGAVDGILLDLGVSSWQLGQAHRGFSFNQDGPLDMRMDQQDMGTAKEILARYGLDALTRILREWGEEPRAALIAKTIIRERRVRPLQTTGELARLIESVVSRRGSHIHPATRSFQGLRIAVNQELNHLESFLSFFPDLLNPQGRAAVISFHSLEDRLVKRGFRDWDRKGSVRLVNRKPIRPAEREIRDNPRSRSARLRICERMEGALLS